MHSFEFDMYAGTEFAKTSRQLTYTVYDKPKYTVKLKIRIHFEKSIDIDIGSKKISLAKFAINFSANFHIEKSSYRKIF